MHPDYQGLSHLYSNDIATTESTVERTILETYKTDAKALGRSVGQLWNFGLRFFHALKPGDWFWR